jgi:hypothetical protein
LSHPVIKLLSRFTKTVKKAAVFLYSDCQKNVPFAEGFFATSAYAAILLCGTYL